VIRASHKTEHYKSCSLVQPGAAWCTNDQARIFSKGAYREKLTQRSFLQTGIWEVSFKSFVSEEVNGFALPQCTSLLAALGPSQTAVCPSTSIQEPKQWPSRATLPNVSQAMVMHSLSYGSWRNQDTICPGQLMSLSSSSIRTCL